MIAYIAGLLCILLVLALSIRVRCQRSLSMSARQVEGMESPMSRAIQATVGYAGGIYITLVMLASFLQIEVPAKIVLANEFSVEPLAFFAVVLTIVQPILLGVWEWLMTKK